MAEYYAQPVEYPSPPHQPDGRQEPRPEEMPEHAHEGTDVNIRPLLVTAAVLVVFLVATCIFIAYLFDLYAYVEQHRDEPASALGNVQVELPAGTPKLQGVPGFSRTGAEDTRDFKIHNQELLTSYSTEKNGLARIPVEEAINIALERKLFKAAAAPVDASVLPAVPTHAESPAKSEAAPAKPEASPEKADKAPEKSETPAKPKGESELEPK